MLHYLDTHLDDYSGVLLESAAETSVHVVQGFGSLFNCALSQRFDDGHTLTDPLVGDGLIFANGRTESVTSANSTAVSLHIRVDGVTLHFNAGENILCEVKSARGSCNCALLEKYAVTAVDFLKHWCC